ncbi:hypothetical protein ECC02_012155 [Trypanosoma cruzi]|uniref:Uncharacterized protein n=1 Tax=Trypanosoma cruzi TaxID=5693 RepID=A0A7J6XLT1_TRYCR|nr:hypothetical protein ECC02_012155 [Trypanosoma cruzi]
MSLSGLLVVVSATRLCCTFVVRLSTYSAPSLLLLCFVFLQAHTTIQDAHCSGFECSFCSACWQLRVAAAFFFRGHEEKGGGEGVRSPSLFSCGCGAPCVAALSWAPCPIEGGMAGNFGAASWMDEGLLARVRCVVAAGFCHFPGAVEMSWGRWWWMSSPPAWWVAAGVVCLPCVDAVSWCVNCAAGPAALSSCCLLSLAVSAALRPSPSCSIPFPSGSRIGSLTPATPLRVMMTAMMTVRLRVVCAVQFLALSCCCCTSVCVTAGEEGVASPTPLLPVPRKQTEDGPKNAGKNKANDNENSSLPSFVS